MRSIVKVGLEKVSQRQREEQLRQLQQQQLQQQQQLLRVSQTLANGAAEEQDANANASAKARSSDGNGNTGDAQTGPAEGRPPGRDPEIKTEPMDYEEGSDSVNRNITTQVCSKQYPVITI